MNQEIIIIAYSSAHYSIEIGKMLTKPAPIFKTHQPLLKTADLLDRVNTLQELLVVVASFVISFCLCMYT